MRIYDAALSTAQVGSSYTAGQNPLGSTPVSVNIDSAGSGYDTVLALWDAALPLTDPTAVAMENDTRALARTNSAPNGPIGAIDGSWLAKSANMANLTVSGLGRVSLTAANTNATQNLNVGGATSPNDISGEQVIVAGGTTVGLASDYRNDATVLQCAALTTDGAPDAIYTFTPTASTTVRVSVETPTPGFSPVVALFDGQNGAPLTNAAFTPPNTAQGSGNDPLTAPAAVPPSPLDASLTSIGTTWTGNTAGFAQDVASALYEEARDYDEDGLALCGGAGGGDAFFTFTTNGTRICRSAPRAARTTTPCRCSTRCR